MNAGNFLKVGIVADDKTKKGISSAEKNIQGLNKSVKSLGKAFATVFAAQKITAFGKASVEAFIEDEKAATKLNTAVKNLGLELSAPSINRYIDNLQRVSGVADDQLRPAFQALITTTGSVTASQKALQQAIDISAGSGVDLTTVAQDLANAYVGNTKGLKKYNLGLSQAQLKAASFADISEKLNKQFSGANAAYLETYAGKMQLISVAAGEAQERIGQGLIDLAMAVTGATNVKDLIQQISNVTDFAIGRLDNFIEGWRILKAIINSNMFDINKNIQKVQVEEFNRRLKRDYMKVWGNVNIPASAQQTAAEKAAEAAARKSAEDLLKATKANTAELKKQNALKKAASIFDLTQIQIIAALKGRISADDRKRLELQLALATENTDEVARLTKELATSQGLGKDLAAFLADLPAAKNPFEAWKDFLDGIESQAMRIASMSFQMPNMSSLYGTPVQNFNPYLTAPFPDTTSPSFIGPVAPNVTVNIEGSVVSEQHLIDAVRGGLNVAALSGSSANVERRIGGW